MLGEIDALYEQFCEELPENARTFAENLPHHLALAPVSGVSWSGVFKHPITLGAPALFTEALPAIRPDALRDASLAHLLAVIRAFAVDRIADGQVARSPDLHDVLDRLRIARNQAMVRLGGEGALERALEADRTTDQAISRETDLLRSGRGVTWAAYAQVSADKQAVGLSATVELARAAGCRPDMLDAIHASLLGAALGLQYRDDVADWEEDATRHGAWAVALARGQVSEPARVSGSLEEWRSLVLSSGVLAELLRRAAEHFDDAGRGAEALGAADLAAWFRERVRATRDEFEHEAETPGYLVRRTKLAAWAAEVLG